MKVYGREDPWSKHHLYIVGEIIKLNKTPTESIIEIAHIKKQTTFNTKEGQLIPV